MAARVSAFGALTSKGGAFSATMRNSIIRIVSENRQTAPYP
jgi:hypothetical protein